MRIAVVAQAAYPTIGGLPVYAETVTSGLVRAGADAILVHGVEPMGKGAAPPEGQRPDHRPVPELASFCDAQESFFASATALWRQLTDIGPQIVYAQDPLSLLQAALVAGDPLHRPRMFLGLHWTFGHWAEGRPRRQWGGIDDPRRAVLFEQQFLANALRAAHLDRLVCVGPAFEAWAAALGVSREQILALPNSVDTGLFVAQKPSGALRQQLAGRGDELLVILPGRLIERKGALLLLQALVLLDDLDVHLALVGDSVHGHPSDDTFRQRVEVAARAAGVENRVRMMVASHADMPRVYSAADVVVLPSAFEGLSTTMLEALACGCAVIASDIPGHREVVRDRENGWLVPRNAAALAAAIRAAADPEQRRRVARHARESVVGTYDMATHAEALIVEFESSLLTPD